MCPVTAHPGPHEGPATKESPPIDTTSLFSALEGQPRRSAAASPPPATNPFQAPDFGDDETYPFEDAQEPAAGTRAARSRAA
ncbi:hypothetical protein GCM10010503_48500 [Streptomyces lucensis JCM 4490]|uniref:Uncharacterized protein n=1 Tax=Streptomyces lucensis JCM 4490 TaxID=1306176 RepID=A0A918MT59_9ACTN|nr:hypothetical protein GCM10010503_48500 [Streptomyces lucensis JCM 4490]